MPYSGAHQFWRLKGRRCCWWERNGGRNTGFPLLIWAQTLCGCCCSSSSSPPPLPLPLLSLLPSLSLYSPSPSSPPPLPLFLPFPLICLPLPFFFLLLSLFFFKSLTYLTYFKSLTLSLTLSHWLIWSLTNYLISLNSKFLYWKAHVLSHVDYQMQWCMLGALSIPKYCTTLRSLKINQQR